MHTKTHSIAASCLSQRGFRTTSLLAALGLSAIVSNASADSLKVDGTPVGAGVPSAIARTNSPETLVPPGFSLQIVVQGIELLENPSGTITRFGFLSDTNSTKTEPDENTYLTLDHNPGGPTPGYDYGRHFLFQGHENSGNRAYITRINLDVVNPDHRITLLTPVGTNGLTGFNSIDGSVWNPFSKTLIFSQEAGVNGGFIEMSSDFDPSTGAGTGLRTLYGSLGRGGFEGVHVDDLGNLILAEDVGGLRVNVDPNDPASPKQAALPNSFIYRFVPNNPADLSQGKLQALQVSIDGQPLVFVPSNAVTPFGDVFSDNQLKLHTLGTTWPVQWVTVHDTAVDGTGAFDANAAAKAAGATPFKRPENLAFQPGSGFQTFFFDATGDTDARAGSQPALAARGSWGSIFRVDLAKNRQTGTLSIVVLGDAAHASFDNLTFANKDVLLAAEDRGDTLHDQLNTLDSVWAFNINPPFQTAPRLVALGRDRLSAGVEDNEPTGLTYSDGDSSVGGLLGSKEIPAQNGLLFFTQQHGENNLYLILGDNHPAAVANQADAVANQVSATAD
jgi:Bacterial protein of unknown function (DUF839)